MTSLNPSPQQQRIELTLLDPKLFVETSKWSPHASSALFFCTPYEGAVTPPFPVEGKKGLSVWVGPLAAFKDKGARLLWELEKRRQRPKMIVLTGQKGRSFMRSYREMGTLLGDTSIAPVSFLRRRGQGWDSLDFFSAGDSPFMEGANPRLKRLKQAGWESMVDQISMADASLKTEYFENLHIVRERLIDSAGQAFRQRKISPLIGVAGECLTKENLYGIFEEPMLQRLIGQLDPPPPVDEGQWLLLAHRLAGQQLLFLGRGVEPITVGQILVAGQGAKNEFAVAEMKQQLLHDNTGRPQIFCWVRVDWRYPPGREIPTLWKQKSALPAGSNAPHG